MTITVTGASGHLGRLVLDALRAGGHSVVGAVRNPNQDLGVPLRHADYDRPETLVPAFEGTDRLLFISGSEPGRRLPQHRAVVEAARAAGVGQIIYTSITKADTSTIPLAGEHKPTEELIVASGVPYVLLRNNWYLENYTANLASALEHGAILGAAGTGRVAAASRADFAAAAVAVLTTDGHEGKVYELGGDQPFTLDELAAEVTAQSGTQVVYRNLPQDEYAQALVGFGLPEAYAQVLAGADVGISKGDLDVRTGDLSRLIGRPTTTLAEAIVSGLK